MHPQTLTRLPSYELRARLLSVLRLPGSKARTFPCIRRCFLLLLGIRPTTRFSNSRLHSPSLVATAVSLPTIYCFYCSSLTVSTHYYTRLYTRLVNHMPQYYIVSYSISMLMSTRGSPKSLQQLPL